MGRKSRLGTAATRVLGVRLTEDEASTLEKLAQARAVKPPDLVRSWIALAAGGVLVPAPALPGHAADTSEAGQTKWLLNLLAQVPAQGLRNLRGGRAVISAMQDLRARAVIAPEVHTRNRVGKKAPADRADPLTVACPKCRARAGAKCTNYKGRGCAPHGARAAKASIDAAAALGASSAPASDVLDQAEHDEIAERVIAFIEASGPTGARRADVIGALAEDGDDVEAARVAHVLAVLERTPHTLVSNGIRLAIAPDPGEEEAPRPSKASAPSAPSSPIPTPGELLAFIVEAPAGPAEIQRRWPRASYGTISVTLAALANQGLIRNSKADKKWHGTATPPSPPKPKLKLSRWRPKTESRTAERQPPIAKAPPVAKPAPKASRRRAQTETIVGEVQTPIVFPKAAPPAPPASKSPPARASSSRSQADVIRHYVSEWPSDPQHVAAALEMPEKTVLCVLETLRAQGLLYVPEGSLAYVSTNPSPDVAARLRENKIPPDAPCCAIRRWKKGDPWWRCMRPKAHDGEHHPGGAAPEHLVRLVRCPDCAAKKGEGCTSDGLFRTSMISCAARVHAARHAGLLTSRFMPEDEAARLGLEGQSAAEAP